MTFAVKIGSQARKDCDLDSDYDILLIGIPNKEFDYSDVPTEYRNSIDLIEYSGEDFHRFHDRGSLFIYHALFEGELIFGNQSDWNRYKNSFAVQTCFREEIERIYESALLLKKTDIYGGKYLSALSNTFLELKNSCIFYLAQNGVYEFRKHVCIKRAIPSFLYFEELELLKRFYDYSIRNRNTLPFNPNDRHKSEKLIVMATNSIQWIRNDCI